jgi:hypothetical protein
MIRQKEKGKTKNQEISSKLAAFFFALLLLPSYLSALAPRRLPAAASSVPYFPG